MANTIAMVMGLLMVLAASGAVAAQPTTPDPGSAPTGTLAEFPIDVLPTPHAEMWLIRYAMGPGSALPSSRQIGPVVIVAESGTVSLVTDQPVEVYGGESGSGASAGATPATDGAIETVLAPGVAVLVREGTTLTVTNDGDADASILTLTMYAAAREDERGGGEPEGDVRSQMLAVTVADLASGPGSVVIERVAAEPGTSADVSLPGGAEIGVVEAGGATIEIAQGQGYVWPQSLTADPNMSPQRQPVRAGSRVDLTAGDGYGYSDATGTWTVPAGGEGAIILRARVIPTGT
jgi:hypothetical protein